MTPLERRIDGIARPVVEALGYRLVLVEFKGGILQVLAENPATGNLGLDDCTKINRDLSPLLEVEDPIPGAYTLEISSPGIDRPLVSVEDFAEYEGFEAKIELDMPTETGQKRFKGALGGIEKQFVLITVDGVEHRLDHANIRKARLVLTDDLIKATAKRRNPSPADDGDADVSSTDSKQTKGPSVKGRP